MNFSTYILHDGKPVLVRFSKMDEPWSGYFVEVHSNKSLLAKFEMQQSWPHYWKVASAAPEWVMHLESQLSRIIYRKQTVASVMYF